MSAPDALRAALAASEPWLRAVPETAAGQRPAPGKWCPKEVLGHLVDSATHNHRRFVQAHWQDDLVFTGYDQDAWVLAQEYVRAPWPELLDLWLAYNAQLARVMEAVPPSIRSRATTAHNLDQIAWQPVPRGQATTLDYLMHDYVDHLHHHLRQLRAATASHGR